MAMTTFATRAGGLVIMSRVPISPRVERFLEALSGSVLVAIAVPATVNGDIATKIAVAASVITMMAFKNTLLAMLLGVVVAALVRTMTT
jgi:uncharacterized membrane protein